MKQNVTLSIESRLLKRAKLFAARRGVSISKLLADDLQSMVEQETRYEQAKRQALNLLNQKFSLGGQGVRNREELHDRAALR